jgi:delta-aminolevulinic acid dehydratase/porphobilinogen synthase
MPRSIVTGEYPASRMRRLRQFDWSRRLTRETRPSPDDLVWGLIVHDGRSVKPHRLRSESLASEP